MHAFFTWHCWGPCRFGDAAFGRALFTVSFTTSEALLFEAFFSSVVVVTEKPNTSDEINLLLQLGRSLCRFIDVLDDRRSCFIASRYCRYPLSIFHSDFFSDLFTLLLWKSVGLEAVFSRGLLGK